MFPRYQLTPAIYSVCLEIVRLVGRFEGLEAPKPKPDLRKRNRIKSIQGSLSIEGNRLDLGQITAIFDGKRVVGPKKDILEVQNAIGAYERLLTYHPFSSRSFREAHGLLMKDLISDAGRWRKGGVGILKGSKVVHVAPPASQIPRLMDELFNWLKKEKDLHDVIKSAIFHYEVEFIHPFQDGNGRIGRLWQTALLNHYSRIFEYVPVESIIKYQQSRYYRALAQADQTGESTPFIEFNLKAVLEGLEQFLSEFQAEPQSSETRLDQAKLHFSASLFSRKDYMQLFKRLSTSTASRDLAVGTKQRLLKKIGQKALSRYRFQ